MSYHRHSFLKMWLVVRRKGNSPIRVVARERHRTKKKADEEARDWNSARSFDFRLCQFCEGFKVHVNFRGITKEGSVNSSALLEVC